MRILSIDLVYSGPSGWTLWGCDQPDPILDYGEFEVKENRKLKDPERYQDIVRRIYKNLIGVANITFWPDIMVYEESDWHQGIGGKEDWKQVYARERKVQRTLGRAEAVAILVSLNLDLEVTSIGANEARHEFGIKGGRNQKKRAAEYFAIEFPRFEFRPENDNAWLYDTLKGQLVSNHISDSFIIGYVMDKRLHKERLVQLAMASEGALQEQEEMVLA